MKNKTKWISETAILIALLIVTQVGTAGLGIPLITGSLVNLILILAILLSGLSSGLVVALLSPIFAKFLGIGPLWPLVGFICLGNLTLILIWWLFIHNNYLTSRLKYIFAILLGAAGKFLILYITIVKWAVPILLALPKPQATIVSAMFSYPQFITATIGGFLALVIFPTLQKALKKSTIY